MASDTTVNTHQLLEDPAAAPPDYQFDVFLSYSRKDEEFARRLEDALENYRLPKDVRTTRPTKKRLTVFRDKHDLVPVGGDYWKTIESYLERSAYLVLVCSPNARRSEYVDHEIKTFLQTHEAKAVIPLLLAGRPNNERGAAQDDYAFPESLSSALSMPLAIGFGDFERSRGKVNKGRHRDAWFTLLAKIFGAERAEIERLDAKRQARRRTIFATAAVAIIAVLSVALVVAVRSRQEAVQQRDQARRLLYASNMSLAQRAFESGNIELGRGLLEPYRSDDGTGQEDLRGFEWYYLWRLYHDHLAVFDDTDAFAFSPDGTVFATATGNTVTLRDAASMRETATIRLRAPEAIAASEAEYYVQSMSFAPDGRTLAYGDSGGVMLIDMASRSAREVPAPKARPQEDPRADRDGTESAQDLYWGKTGGGTPRFSRDGRLLAVSYGCGMVVVFDRQSLREIVRLGEGPPASGCMDFVEFSPDGRFLAYGDVYSVKLWHTVTGRDLGGPEQDVSHPDRVDQVEAIGFSPDSNVLAIGDRSKQLVLWHIASRRVVGRLTGHSDWVSAIAFSPDGNSLYTGSVDQSVRRWDVSSFRETGRVTDAVKVVATLRGHAGSINSVHASPAGTIVATVGSDRTVKLWSQASGREFEAFEDVAAVSRDVGLMAKAVDETITFFDARGAEPARLATVKGLNLTLSPDGKAFTTTEGYPTATTRLWSLSTDGRRAALRATVTGESPAFSADGRLFAALGSKGTTLMLWDATTFRQLMPIGTAVGFSRYFVSPDGAVVVTVDRESFRIRSWAAQSAAQLASVERKMAAGVLELSPVGRLLAIADGNEIALWALDSDQAPIPLGKHGTAVTALAFSPNGRWMASGDESGRMKVWDLISRSERAEFAAFKDPVNTLAFSPDARTLASGGITVKLYGLASMRELITLAHPPSPTSEIHAAQGGEDVVQEIVFAPDGTSLATRSGNGMLRIWRGVNAATGSTARP